MTEKGKCAAGYLYNANYDEEINREISKCNDKCYKLNQLKPSDRKNQRKMLKKILGYVGKNAAVNPPFWVDYGYKTSVGDYFFANRNCQIQDGGSVTFGNHVFIGPNCCFTTAEHAIDAEQRNSGMEIALPVVVGNNVWIGAGSTILAGVTIGDNSIIGAGSVVTKDIPPNVIAIGVPCKVLRPITDDDKNRYPSC